MVVANNLLVGKLVALENYQFPLQLIYKFQHHKPNLMMMVDYKRYYKLLKNYIDHFQYQGLYMNLKRSPNLLPELED
jgi:hypothetical protein